MKKMTPKDLPLTCRIKDGVVTISCGVETLAFLTKVGLKSEGQWPKDVGAITCSEGFCSEMLNAVNEEREDGSTKLTDLLDWAALEAIEHGSQYVNHLDKGKIDIAGETTYPRA